MENYRKLTDEDLVSKILSLDKELYSILIERYEKKIIRYVNHLVNDKEKAVDITQESFIKAFINLESFDQKKKFSSWLYRIAHNESVNVIKKYNKEMLFPEDMDFRSDEDIEENFEQKENSEKIEKYIKEMPILYSEPLFLLYFEEKSYQEISDILRIPMGTVATRINRAKTIMKKIWKKN